MKRFLSFIPVVFSVMMLLVVPTIPHHHEEGLVCIELDEHDHDAKSGNSSEDNNCAADTKFVSRSLEMDVSDHSGVALDDAQLCFFLDFYACVFLLHEGLRSTACNPFEFSQLKINILEGTGLNQLGFRAPPALFS